MRCDVEEKNARIDPGAAFKIGKREKVRGSRLDPAAKEWMDLVFIPAIVRLYLAEFGATGHNGMRTCTERVQ